MDDPQPLAPSTPSEPRPTNRPGYLAGSKAGYPVLFEDIDLMAARMVRVRRLNWAAGFSGLVYPDDLRPITSLLLR